LSRGLVSWARGRGEGHVVAAVPLHCSITARRRVLDSAARASAVAAAEGTSRTREPPGGRGRRGRGRGRGATSPPTPYPHSPPLISSPPAPPSTNPLHHRRRRGGGVAAGPLVVRRRSRASSGPAGPGRAGFCSQRCRSCITTRTGGAVDGPRMLPGRAVRGGAEPARGRRPAKQIKVYTWFDDCVQ
jgi:hypothetical protein